MMEQRQHNGGALVDHWAWAAQKGLMNQTTARLIENACRQVLKTQDGWETIDVQTLDVDETFRRFVNLSKLAPRSLRDYKRRFIQGVESFRAFLNDPASWRGPQGEKPRRSELPNGSPAQREPRSRSQNGVSHRPVKQDRDDENLIEYPFPIRPGLTASLRLPPDLTASEAKRIGSFIATLAMESATAA